MASTRNRKRSSFTDRLYHAWNAFAYEDKNRPSIPIIQNGGYSFSSTTRMDRKRLTYSNEKSIVASVYNRIAIDVAAIDVRHARVDENGIFLETMNSSLNYCLNTEASIDQTSREFMMDVVYSMFDEGTVAIVVTDARNDIMSSNVFDINELRTGKIVQWYPHHVRVEVYNGNTGQKEEITLPKDKVAIIENPLYSVMNEPNSTLKRLIHKLNLLDAIDEQSGSSKLDLIIQLPYVIKGEARLAQAEKRKQQLEEQLRDSKYGIAYIDGTEKVTQLNRSAENNLMSQIEYLTSMLYSQLGLTQAIFDGTADAQATLNYYNRTIEPVLAAITDEIQRKFLTKTARSQGQRIIYMRNPFKLIPVDQIAELSDKLSRNEILTGNEIRSLIGFKPSQDPNANVLRNKNLNQSAEEALPHDPTDEVLPNGEAVASNDSNETIQPEEVKVDVSGIFASMD